MKSWRVRLPIAFALRQLTDQYPIAEEELSEEDQQLKNELDMMVERLQVRINARGGFDVCST